MRKLSESFMNDLVNRDGVLHPILERVKGDATLMLAIREDYINIYYRGGNILRIKEKGKHSYSSSFDNNYDKSGEKLPALPANIQDQDDARTWVNAFPLLKEIMDIWFFDNPKLEREFQQLVARENDYAPTSKNHKYFVSDIEFADTSLGARFDISAIRWLTSPRKKDCNCRATLIEMKYGNGAALDNKKTGLLKHLVDIDAFISDSEKYKYLLKTMESQFRQFDELGLTKYNPLVNRTKVQLNASEKPEVVFLLANHNPRSTDLLRVLADLKDLKYEENERFDLRFFVSQFAGYGLHSDCMLTLSQFRDLLKC